MTLTTSSLLTDRAAELVANLNAEGRAVRSIPATAKTKFCTTFWGQAWCQHLGSYELYQGSFGLGRRWLRAGCLVDLAVTPGEIVGVIATHEEPAELRIRVASFAEERAELLAQEVAGDISSVADVLTGSLSNATLRVLTSSEHGLFPEPTEISFACNCLEDSEPCSHAAAALYGVGMLFDEDPRLFFQLREFDLGRLEFRVPDDGGGAMSDAKISDVFGIDLV